MSIHSLFWFWLLHPLLWSSLDSCLVLSCPDDFWEKAREPLPLLNSVMVTVSPPLSVTMFAGPQETVGGVLTPWIVHHLYCSVSIMNLQYTMISCLEDKTDETLSLWKSTVFNIFYDLLFGFSKGLTFFSVNCQPIFRLLKSYLTCQWFRIIPYIKAISRNGLVFRFVASF